MNIFGTLQNLRDRPIGGLAAARAVRRDFRTRIPIAHGPLYDEPLREAADMGLAGTNFYHSERNPPYWRRIKGSTPKLLLRLSVAERLARVNARAAAAGLELYLFDAWRPRAVQAYFHDVWMPQELRRRGSRLEGAALMAQVERYWAVPSADENSPAPHATGGAVDLTLRWKDGDALWMGSLFDDVTALSHRDQFENLGEDISFSNEEARANRRLLHWLMHDEGFAGHPDEWWHFSWGDQLWAALTGAPAAHFGLAVTSEQA